MRFRTWAIERYGDKISKSREQYKRQWVNKQVGKAGVLAVCEFLERFGIKYERGTENSALDVKTEKYGIEVKYYSSHVKRVKMGRIQIKRKKKKCKNKNLIGLTIAVTPSGFFENIPTVEIKAKLGFKNFQISKMHDIIKYFPIAREYNKSKTLDDYLEVINMVHCPVCGTEEEVENKGNLKVKIDKYGKEYNMIEYYCSLCEITFFVKV